MTQKIFVATKTFSKKYFNLRLKKYLCAGTFVCETKCFVLFCDKHKMESSPGSEHRAVLCAGNKKLKIRRNYLQTRYQKYFNLIPKNICVKMEALASNRMEDSEHELWTRAGIFAVGGWCPHMSPLPHILIQCQLMPGPNHPLAAATHFPRLGYRAWTR